MAFKTKLARPITPEIVEIEVADQVITPRKLLPGEVSELFLRDRAGNIIYDRADAPVSVPKLRLDDINTIDLPGPIGRYIQRRCALPDFFIGAPFIADGNFYFNQLNLSGIVPRDAVAVLLCVQFDGVVGNQIYFSPDIIVMPFNSIGINADIAQQMINVVFALDTLANDRMLDVRLDAGITTCNVAVAGYFV
jgi:hypothetical protein